MIMIILQLPAVLMLQFRVQPCLVLSWLVWIERLGGPYEVNRVPSIVNGDPVIFLCVHYRNVVDPYVLTKAICSHKGLLA